MGRHIIHVYEVAPAHRSVGVPVLERDVKSGHSLPEGQLVNSAWLADKFPVHQALGIKKGNQHHLADTKYPPGNLRVWLHSSEPFLTMLFGVRVLAVHPRFVHCHGVAKHSRRLDLEVAPKIANCLSSLNVVVSQQTWNKFGTLFTEVQVFFQDALHCCVSDPCLSHDLGYGNPSVICNKALHMSDVSPAPP